MMKKIILTAIVALFSLPALFAQARPVYSRVDYDFGTINEVDGSVSTDFIVKNTGDKPLFFTDVKASCGCTKPEWTMDSIPPGGEGFVRARFDPTNLPGPFEKVVYVKTNGIPAQTTLVFRGTVNPRPFNIADKYPIEFGRLRFDNNYFMFGEALFGQIDSVEIEVYNQSNTDLSITNVTHIPDYVNLVIEPSTKIKAKTGAKIKAFFNTKASNKWGEQNYVFYLNTTDSIYTTEIPLYAQVHIREVFPKMSKKQLDNAPKIQVDAPVLYLGKILRGDSVNFQYTVTNMGKTTLQVRGVNTSCGCTASVIDKSTLKRGESTIVRGTFYSAGREGIQDKTITIVSNDPVTPELRLHFNTEIVTNPNALKY